ncbi:MAG TPA: ABC transporter ATP-binding protein [Chitinophagaceae bacterium]|nr:ABC transporter ATP-binding protein [Chitinophagaceae bacterium]
MSSIIQVAGLSKHFKAIRAVDDLSFSVNKGEIYGFLGQNGAGKSTTIRMLLTLIQPTRGTIQVFGKDLQSHRNKILKQIGAIIEKPDLYKFLTALQNLHLFARLSKVKRTTKELMHQLEIVGIAERATSKVKTFSQGMKQRLGIACALIHDPELIILDEPTNGLDPHGIADVRNLLLHLSKNEGKTIVVSSHLLSEIELIADSMLIIDKGKKIAEGKVKELLNPADIIVKLETTDNIAALKKLQKSSWQKSLKTTNEKIFLAIHQEKIPALAKALIAMDIEIMALQPKHSLEDYFLSLTTNYSHVAAYQH